MDFNRESWRKLYLRENLDQQGWPLFTRGLRDLLVRLARDDGTLVAHTDSPGDDLAAKLKADADEQPLVVGTTGLMLDDGYLSHRRGRLFITRFEEAQARTTSTERVRKHRAKVAESADSETLPKQNVKPESETDPTLPDPTLPEEQLSESDKPTSAERDEVWAHWVGWWKKARGKGKAPSLLGKRKRMLATRLREGYTVAQLKRAADGCWTRQYNLENNYLDPELVYRDGGQVEKYIGFAMNTTAAIREAEHEDLKKKEAAAHHEQLRLDAKQEAEALPADEQAAAWKTLANKIGNKL